METQTLSQIKTPIWNVTKRGAMIESGSITLTLLNEGNNNWSLVITIANNSTYHTLKAQNLEEAKGNAVLKFRNIIDNIIIDSSEIVLSSSTEVLDI
jgi:hypothetical protein